MSLTIEVDLSWMNESYSPFFNPNINSSTMIPSSVHLGGSPNPTARLPIVDLDAPDRASTIREACVEYGFFYLVNHGVDQELVESVLEHSRKFFSLPLDRKNQLLRNHHRGYTPLFSENLDPSSSSKGDSKESFYIGPLEGDTLNQWPPPDLLPSWRITMEAYYEKLLCAGKKLVSVIALALNLDEDYFEKIGALVSPDGFLRLLHYPGDCTEEMIGASEHSDYGMITLLMTDGVPGLQVCKEKDKQPRVWEDVLHVKGVQVHETRKYTTRKYTTRHDCQGVHCEHRRYDGEVDKLLISINSA
ncbi:hypothetical protein OROMI_017649 [Orobanche minor]